MTKALSVVAQKREKIKSTIIRALDAGARDMLPAHIAPTAMLASFAGALTRNPQLLDCQPVSFVEALILSATAALPPDGYHGHLVKYGDKVTFIPDYKGLVQLALRNGVVIEAHAVYSKDRFDYRYGTDPMILHTPCEDEDRGELRCAYAVARFDNQHTFVVATKAEVERRKKASRASSHRDSPWQMWEPEMWIKTAVKMLAKFIPRTADVMAITNAIDADNAYETGKTSEYARELGKTVIEEIDEETLAAQELNERLRQEQEEERKAETAQ
jgi:recombination protein RecT